MSFDLGNWADKLTCEMCEGERGPVDLTLSFEDLMELLAEDDGGVPDDFWDEPPAPPEPFDLGDLIPDPHPYAEFPDDGFIFGIEGTF